MEGFFGLTPYPSENSSLASYFPLNILAFEIPLPPWNFQWPSWGEYGYFLEPRIIIFLLTF